MNSPNPFSVFEEIQDSKESPVIRQATDFQQADESDNNLWLHFYKIAPSMKERLSNPDYAPPTSFEEVVGQEMEEAAVAMGLQPAEEETPEEVKAMHNESIFVQVAKGNLFDPSLEDEKALSDKQFFQEICGGNNILVIDHTPPEEQSYWDHISSDDRDVMMMRWKSGLRPFRVYGQNQHTVPFNLVSVHNLLRSTVLTRIDSAEAVLEAL